eukprot:3717574-Rhodomonas_salina.2
MRLLRARAGAAGGAGACGLDAAGGGVSDRARAAAGASADPDPPRARDALAAQAVTLWEPLDARGGGLEGLRDAADSDRARLRAVRCKRTG